MTRSASKLLTILAIMCCCFTNYANPSEVCLAESEGGSSSCCHLALAEALRINAEVDEVFPISNPQGNPQLAADRFASFFAPGGIFQAVGAPPSIGVAAIRQLWLNYSNNVFGDNDSNQHVINHQFYWDQEKATLTIERTWVSTLTAPRNFCGTTLPAGATYMQDDAVIVRFACANNCDSGCFLPGKIVYYHEYFDTCQTRSAYTEAYPQPCDCLGEHCNIN